MGLALLTIASAPASAIGLPVPSVGPATVETTADTATITVPVMALGLAADWHVDYGLTNAYGSMTGPIALPLTGGIAQMRTTITGLAADGRYHYRSVLSGPWTVPVVTPDATFDTTTAVIGIDDGELGGGDDGTGGTTSLGTEDAGETTAAPAPAPTSAGPVTPTPSTTPATLPAPAPSATPRAIVTARGGTLAIALSGSPSAVTLKLPARAATRARLAITTAGRTRSARLQGPRAVRIGSARALVRTGHIVISRLPARTTSLRLTPAAGTRISARQVTATAS